MGGAAESSPVEGKGAGRAKHCREAKQGGADDWQEHEGEGCFRGHSPPPLIQPFISHFIFLQEPGAFACYSDNNE